MADVVKPLLKLGVIGVVVLGLLMVHMVIVYMVVSKAIRLPDISAILVCLVFLVVTGYIVLGLINVARPVLAEFVKEFGMVAELVISVDIFFMVCLVICELRFWFMVEFGILVEASMAQHIRLEWRKVGGSLPPFAWPGTVFTQLPFAWDTVLKWFVFICLGLAVLLLKKLTGWQVWIPRREAMVAVAVAFQLLLGSAILEEHAKLAAWEWRTIDEALWEGDVSAVRWFYRRYESTIDQVMCNIAMLEYPKFSYRGKGVYNIAAYRGRMDMVWMLMKEGEDVNQVSADGTTALISAAAGGHVKVARLLLDAKAEVEAKVGRTALISAAAGGHVKVARLLLDAKAEINYFPPYQPYHTALHEASLKGHLEVARFLVQNGAKLDLGVWHPPLHVAAKEGHVEMVKFLLEQGAHVDEADRSLPLHPSTGLTALHQATSFGHNAVVRELVKAKANIYATTTFFSMTTRWGARTALDIARERNPHLLQILEESE